MKQHIRSRIGKSLTLAVCITAVVIAMGWLSGAFRKAAIRPAVLQSSDEQVDGKRMRVEKVARPAVVDLVGNIESRTRTTVSSRIAANIVEIGVQAGQRITKGDLLIRLDDRDVKARVAQAQEVTRAAEATRDLAAMEVNRLTPLVEQRVASVNELDQWRSKLAGANADVLRSREAIKEAEVALSDTLIYAPFDAIVIDRQAEPGDMASPGKALLSIYDPVHLRLDAAVREAYIGRLEQLRNDQRELEVRVDAIGRTLKGTIEQIVPAADLQSRSFTVKVRLADSGELYPGMFGRLRVPMEMRSVLEIPVSAVHEIGQVPIVMVQTEGGGAGAARRAVRLGAVENGRTEVLAGLSEGEEVIVR